MPQLRVRRSAADLSILLAAAVTAACVEARIIEPEHAEDAQSTPAQPALHDAGAQLVGARYLVTPTAFDFGQVALGESSPPQSVTVTNLGPGSVSPSMAGGAAGVFGGSTDCQGATLDEGESCRISYRFSPTEAGIAEASTSGTIDGEGFAFEFRGEGVAQPRYRITPTALDFGQVSVGTTSAAQVVTVTNLGPGSISPSMAGGAAGVFGGTTNCQGSTLEEGESCSIIYRFSPTEAGTADRSTSGSINGQAFAFEFRGEGLALSRFSITPTALDFGEIVVGETSTAQVILVTNNGPGAIAPQMAGGAAGEFGGSTNCQGSTLAEGESCEISYRFTPAEAGPASRTTSGSISGQSFSFNMQGIGISHESERQLRFRMTPVAFDFGEVAVGATSPPQVVTVTNIGPGPIAPQMAGGAAGEFGGSTNCQGATLNEGDSCQITYRFTPVQPGEAMRSTSGSISGQTFSFEFRGVGVAVDRFLITPVAFDFGSVDVGTSSEPQQAVVTNLGPGSTAIQIAGGAAGEFGGSTNCGGITLQENESCHITYRYTPTEPGEAQRSTSGSINGQPFAFDLRGFGFRRDRYLITPTGFDFGEVLLGTTSIPQVAVVTNLGPGAVTPNVAGGAAGVFGGSTNCQGVTLEEGETCEIRYRFTPQELGLTTGSTSGSIDGQAFAFAFLGTGVSPAIAGFLPPAERPGRIVPGSTLPVKLELTDIVGEPIADELAAELAAACAVVVTFTGDPGVELCADYDAGDRHFRVNLRIPRDLAPGSYSVGVEVRFGGAVVATESVVIAVW